MGTRDGLTITVTAGKGETGKTFLVGAFAALVRGKVLADCDVDAADLYLILNPKLGEAKVFHGSKEAILDKEKCIECGVCRKNCRFEAIDEDFNIDPFRCEGCGVCAFLCPVKAIELQPRVSGYVRVSSTRFGTLVHGELVPGEGTSGKLVTLVKQRALGLAHHFRTQGYVVINKHDLNPEMTRRIEGFARAQGLEVVGRIPYDKAVIAAVVHGQTVIEYADADSPATRAIRRIWERMAEVLALEEVAA